MSAPKPTARILLINVALLLTTCFLFVGCKDSPTQNASKISAIQPTRPASAVVPTISNAKSSSEFQELDAILKPKGTSICSVIKTINLRRDENFKKALAKYPNEDTRQGKYLMELNQATLDEVKNSFDIDRRMLGTIFRLGASGCK